MPDGIPAPPKRPKLTLRPKAARKGETAPSEGGRQTVIALGHEPSVPGNGTVPEGVASDGGGELPPTSTLVDGILGAGPDLTIPTADKLKAIQFSSKPWSTAPKPAGEWNGSQSTLIGSQDHSAQSAMAAGNAELLREKLRHSEPAELRRKGFFSDAPDKGLFIAFAILGFGGIFTAKEMAYSGLPVALAAVGLLAAYAFVASRLPAFKSNPDRLGDNCYYMGFLFTLASLSAALVALQRDSASGRGDLLEALIGGFGVALFSTIAGITLRVFFMQMRREIEDLEEQLRTELQRSAALLKDQLAQAVMDLENFRLRTGQVMSEQVNDAASGFSGLAEKLIEYVTIAGSAYSRASEGFASNADRVATDIGRLVDQIEQIDIPSDLLTRQVDDARSRSRRSRPRWKVRSRREARGSLP